MEMLTILDGAGGVATDDLTHRSGALAVIVRRLRGGVREGVRLVELVAGTTRVLILPDRGLGIWKMFCGEVELGWQSPVRGPVHPRFVPLAEPSGLGWLDGFDELVARCGLVSNGAPDFAPSGRLQHGLHGQIANLPAHELSVLLDSDAGTIQLRGAVDETRFLCHNLRMSTTLTLRADRPAVEWSDSVENLSDRPATLQMLYHINFGPPLLGAGAELVADVAELAPRDAGAEADVPSWNRYAAPQPGRAEQVHYAHVRPAAQGVATALLVAPEGQQAVRVTWGSATLPCFALWKNQGGLADGYVTGIEPGTNFPNPRSFEAAQGRVVELQPHAKVQFDLGIEHLQGAGVAPARAALQALAGGREPARIHATPRPGWSAVASAIAHVMVVLAGGLAAWQAGGDGRARGAEVESVAPVATAVQTGPRRRVIAADDSRRTLASIAPDGRVEWRQANGAIHDLHLLPNGHLLLQNGWTRIVELDEKRQPVWEYDAKGGDNAGRGVEVHAFQRLDDGATMIVESGPARILEVNADGAVRKTVPLKVEHPAVHSDTRNASKTAAGTYLVAHERDGAVREYDATGTVIWEYPVPLFGRERREGHGPEAFGNQLYSAVRLPSGNTLIGTGNGHGVLEVTPQKEIVWRLDQHDLPGITLAWVTQVRRLPSGNTLLINCHAGPDNPQIIEVDPAKKVVWTFKDFTTFGNALPVAVVADPE